MQIGFEAKRLFSNFTGLGNYSRFVVNALAEHNPEQQLHLYTPRLRQHPEIDPIVARSNVTVHAPQGLYRKPLLSSLWRTWAMSYERSVASLNVFHGLSQELPFGLPTQVKRVVTVHDLIFLRYPEFYNPIDVWIYKSKVRSACERADKVIAISHQTAEDLVNLLKVDLRKIEVVYQGCHPNFKRVTLSAEREQVRQRYDLPAQFILNVGTIESRKNVGLLVQALAQLPPSLRLPLVIVGRATPYLKTVQQTADSLGVASLIHYRHQVAFADFPALYQQARVFVYPSLFEGFGIPLVEAIQSNIPVITSTGSCFQEAAGPDSLYIDAQDAGALAGALETVLSHPAKAQEMVDRSAVYIRQFEPSVIASRLQQVYHSL